MSHLSVGEMEMMIKESGLYICISLTNLATNSVYLVATPVLSLKKAGWL